MIRAARGSRNQHFGGFQSSQHMKDTGGGSRSRREFAGLSAVEPALFVYPLPRLLLTAPASRWGLFL
jgi:hypothetical protein